MCEKIIINIHDNQYEIRIIKEDNILYNAKDIGNCIKLADIYKTISNIKKEKVLKKVKTAGGNQQMIFLTENGVKILLSKSRKPCASELAKCLGMCINDIYTHNFESSTLQSIIYVFKSENFKSQYYIDKYRIDLYFIDYKLAIECDENRHNSKKENDEIRQTYIESKLNCKFIRYNPEEKDFNIFKVIGEIYEHLKLSKQFPPGLP